MHRMERSSHQSLLFDNAGLELALCLRCCSRQELVEHVDGLVDGVGVGLPQEADHCGVALRRRERPKPVGREQSRLMEQGALVASAQPGQVDLEESEFAQLLQSADHCQQSVNRRASGGLLQSLEQRDGAVANLKEFVELHPGALGKPRHDPIEDQLSGSLRCSPMSRCIVEFAGSKMPDPRKCSFVLARRPSACSRC